MTDEHELPEEYDVVNFEEHSEEDVYEEEVYDEDEYEEIDPEEVDRVVAVLNDLIEKATSQTIKDYLESTCSDIACLLDDYEEEDDLEAEAA